MENKFFNPQENSSSKFILFKRVSITILIFVLMIGSFQAGLFVATKNDNIKKVVDSEKYYLGKVSDLYSVNKPESVSKDIDFNLFWKVWDSLKNNYVDKDKLTDKKMFYGALKGMVASAGDPYTIFMDPKVAEDFSNDLAGTFEGIGAEIGMKDEVLTIVAPLPGMPAEKAGLKAGDKIVSINGESTTGFTVEEGVSKIRGPKGTEVTLTIFRDGFKKVEDFKLLRDTIVVKSVNGNLRDDKIYVIKVSNFNDDTDKLFNEQIQEVLKLNPKGLIADLRNNPGGYLETAISMASEWVEDGVVVTEKYSPERKFDHLAEGRARIKGIPTVILVNQGSASASEILSGALQDNNMAVILGMTTFGKGSVQTLSNFDDGSSIKVTVAKWLTPSGRSINDEGIKPDVEVDITEEEYNANKDPQMDKAVEILNNGPEYQEIIKKDTPTTATSSEAKK